MGELSSDAGRTAGSALTVFIAHATEDILIATDVKSAFFTAGIEPFCFEDHWTGQFPVWIAERILAVDFFLLIWSGNARNSPWVRQEWSTAQTLCVEHDKPQLCTLILEEVPLEPWAVGYPSFRLPQLSRAIDLMMGLHAKGPGKRTGAYAAPTPICEIKGISEPSDLCGLPSQLLTMLSDGTGPVLLYGEPGAGKTHVADAVANVLKDKYRIIRQGCVGRREVDIVAELARELADAPSAEPAAVQSWKAWRAFREGSTHSSKASEEQIATVKRQINECRTLIIFDGVAGDELKRLLPSPPALVICTSRRRCLPFIPSSRSIEITGMTKCDAEAIFDGALPLEMVERYQVTLWDLVDRFEHSAAAIVESATRLRTSYEDPRRTLERLHRFDLPQSVALWSDATRSIAPDSRRLLAAMSVCSVHGAELAFASGIAEIAESESYECRDCLVEQNLLKVVSREQQEFRLHILLYKAITNSQLADELRARHAMTVEDSLSTQSFARAKCSRLREVPTAVEWLRANGQNQRMMALLGSGLDAVVHMSSAEQEAVVELERRCLGPGRKVVDQRDVRVLRRIYLNRGRLLQTAGRLPEAKVLFERALSLSRRLADWKGQRDTLGALARICSACGEMVGALGFLVRQSSVCHTNKDLARECSSLGKRVAIHLELGELEQAQRLLRKRHRLCESAGRIPFTERSDSLASLWASLTQASGERQVKKRPQAGPSAYQRSEALRFAWTTLPSVRDKSNDLFRTVKDFTSEQLRAKLELLRTSYNDPSRMALEFGSINFPIHYVGASPEVSQSPFIPPLFPVFSAASSANDPRQNYLELHLKERADEALAHVSRREKQAEEEEDGRLLANLYGLRARILTLSDRRGEALDTLRKQSEMILRVGDRFDLEECYGRQAVVLSELGRHQEAAVALEQQITLAGVLQFEESLGYAHWNWGFFAAARGHVAAAQSHLAEASTLLESLGWPHEARLAGTDFEELFAGIPMY